ncbi:MAG TPA: hypothetical protein P5060_00285 [Candidatus Absconditabacterales bacterium]|nr:hypothetical protein [Candidatus Absconditabacterales bacterium]
MRFLIPESTKKQANKIGISIDDLFLFVQNTFPDRLVELCSPLPNTIVYKGYIHKIKRLVLFYISDQKIIYPVYVGDKKDQIAKNITIDLVRKQATRQSIKRHSKQKIGN